MARFLHAGVQKIEVLMWYECDPSATFMDFRDEFFAYRFLRDFMNNPLNMMTLREVLVESLPITNVFRLTDDDILEQLAWQIARGRVRLVLHEYASAMGTGGSADSAEAEEEEQEEPAPVPADATQEETYWIAFQVIDDEANEPMSGIRLKVKLPTGAVNEYTTNADGLVRIDNLPSGTCDIEEIFSSYALEIVQVE